MSNKMNDTTADTRSKIPSDKNPLLEKAASSSSQILIQKNLPQHSLNPTETKPEAATKTELDKTTTPNPKEKWSRLKSSLQSAVSDWSELEKKAPQKTQEEEQMEKVRSLISNLKERLAEF